MIDVASSGPISRRIARRGIRRLVVASLALVLVPGCSSRPGPVAVRPIASPATAQELKDKEKNPLITRD
jgi:hypothetical protein